MIQTVTDHSGTDLNDVIDVLHKELERGYVSHRQVIALAGLITDGRQRALQGITALHKPYGIYDECGHDHGEDDEGVVEVDDVGFVCDDGLMYQVCQHCCVTGKHFYDYQTEECVSEHQHGKDDSICPTVAAIAGALS